MICASNIATPHGSTVCATRGGRGTVSPGAVSGENGSLFLHPTGQSAFSVYNRANSTAVRLVLKPVPEGITRENSFAYYQALDPIQMFDVEPARYALP